MINIYLAMPAPQGLLIVTGQDSRWQTAQKLAGQQTQCLAIDPLKPDRIYCGTMGDGLYASDDAGESWQRAGLEGKNIMSVAVSQNERVGDYGVVYAGTEPSNIFRSEDGGKTWQDCSTIRDLPSAPTWSFPPRPETSHVRAIALDPNEPGHIYVAIEAGALVRSYDGGKTWQDRTPDGPLDTHTLLMHPLAPRRIYSAAGDGYMRPGREFAESFDGGDTWQRPDAGITHYTYGWGLAVDPSNPDRLVISSAYSPNQAHNPNNAESVVYLREGDSSWQRVTEGLPEAQGTLAYQLASNENQPGYFYAASNTGLFRSKDAGKSWEQIDIPWQPAYSTRRVNALAVTGSE